MFSVKIIGNAKEEILSKTISNIVNFISNKIGFENTKILTDKNSTEIISGNEKSGEGDQIVVELLIRKHIIINNSDFKDRVELDKHLQKIKHFCEQAKSIEELKYLPINMR